MRLVEALQTANKDFELMIYQRSRHGIFRPHYSRLQLDFIRRTLGQSRFVPPAGRLADGSKYSTAQRPRPLSQSRRYQVWPSPSWCGIGRSQAAWFRNESVA